MEMLSRAVQADCALSSRGLFALWGTMMGVKSDDATPRRTAAFSLGRATLLFKKAETENQ